MKHQFISLSAWISENPQRFRTISVCFAASMTVLALIFPEAVAFAGWAPGTSD